VDWQVMIVTVGVIVSAIALFGHFRKTIKKPESACDSCPIKKNCTANCEYQKGKTIIPAR